MHLPNTFVVAGVEQKIASLRSRLTGRGLEMCLQECSQGRLVANLLPSEISGVLALVHETGVLTLECTSSAQLVTTAQDRRARPGDGGPSLPEPVPGMQPQTLLPVSLLQQGTNSISTWCIGCSAYVEPVVDRGDYARLAFLPSGAVVVRVPPDSTESLRGPISTEDQEYGLQQLPNGKVPGDSCLPYEMLKGATAQVP